MFDVPQVLSRGLGTPSVPGNPYVCKTLIMFLNDNITRTKNYGAAGAISVILFIVCAAFSMLVYYFFTDRNLGGAKSFEGKDKKSKKKKEA